MIQGMWMSVVVVHSRAVEHCDDDGIEEDIGVDEEEAFVRNWNQKIRLRCRRVYLVCVY